MSAHNILRHLNDRQYHHIQMTANTSDEKKDENKETIDFDVIYLLQTINEKTRLE